MSLRRAVGLLVLWVMPGLAVAGDWLGDLTWPEAARRVPESTVIIPFGAGAKEHGPHLPMNTDQVVL